MLAAAIVRLSGADPFDVLAIAGFVNAVILAAGFRAFVRIFTKSHLTLILSAAFALFLWGSARHFISGSIRGCGAASSTSTR